MVFLDFNDHNISRYNYRQIVCFPNARAEELPMVENPRQKKQKADLDRIDRKFVFRDLEDLKNNYKSVFM